uniref:ZAD domain-containing protein n=1 Tax=Anopheles minimus TaxID=112268 RepID=A0A182WN52_9DIPT
MCAATCRLCFKYLDPDDPDSRSILDETLQIAFNCVFPFKILFKEDLPMYVCKQCTWNVLDFHSYSEIVQKNQETFEIKQSLDNATVQNGNEKEEMDKENTEPMLEQYVPCEFNVDNIALVHCKAELDEILVANEIHPDLMEYSFEGSEECYASITCENYKITASVYDDATELPESFHTCNNLNDTSVEQNETPVCHSAINSKDDNNETRVLGKKKKCLKKSQTTDKLNMTNKRLPEKTNAESCIICGKKYPSKQSLYNHQRAHRTTTCQICKRTLQKRNLTKHLEIHKTAKCCSLCAKSFMDKKTLKHHIETKHSSNSKLKKL